MEYCFQQQERKARIEVIVVFIANWRNANLLGIYQEYKYWFGFIFIFI